MPVLRSYLESRVNLENPEVPLTAGNLATILNAGESSAGVNVSQAGAVGITAVWCAVNTLAGQGASLPLHAYRESDAEQVQVQILRTPNPIMTAYEYWEFKYTSLLLWGNAYSWKVRDGLGRLRELWPINPAAVKVGLVVGKDGSREKIFEVQDKDGVKHPYTDAEIFHIVGPMHDGIVGRSPIEAARQAIGMALAAEEYGAKFFGSGALMSGILQTDQRLERDQAEALKQRWQNRNAGISNAHTIAVLDSGAKFEQISIPPGDAQFIESRKFQIAEIARLYGTPPHMLMDTEKSTSWGTGIEEQTTGFVKFQLGARWLKRVEERVTRDLTPPGVHAKYALKGLLRGDTKTQAQYYAQGRQWGWLSQNDINRLEDRPPVPGGDTYLVPMNMQVIDADGNPVGPVNEPGGDEGPSPDGRYKTAPVPAFPPMETREPDGSL